MRRPRSRFGFVPLIMVMLASSLFPWPAAAVSGRQMPLAVDADSAIPPDPATPPDLNAGPPTVLDNFNRTVVNGWGSSSSGPTWVSFLTPPAYTVSVNGQAGVLSGVGLGSIPPNGNQASMTYQSTTGRWNQPSWTWTSKFKVSVVPVSPDGTVVWFAITRGDGFPLVTYFRVAVSTQGSVTLGGPFGGVAPKNDWLPDTWYTVKFLHAWGDQSRLKIWPSDLAEPTTWLLSRNASQDDIQSPTNTFPMVSAGSTVQATTSFDDFTFGDAPILPKVPMPPGTDHNPPFVNEDEAGDPVSTLTGTFSDSHVDVAIPGRGPSISMTRSYNSNDTRVTSLGPGWTHSYNIRLTDPDDGTGDVVLVGPQGRSDRYVQSAGSFVPPVGVHRSLVRNADKSYTSTDKDLSSWLFDATGKLTRIQDRFGNASNLTYDANGRLATVGDPAGRGALTFSYTNGLLTAVTDWASPARSINYQYDGSGRLWKATDREAKTTTFAYDGTSHRIATITDGRGLVTLVNTYDAQGRVATQKDGRGVVTGDVTTFAYVANQDGTTSTTLTLPPTSFEASFHPTLADTYDTHGWLVGRVTRPSTAETLTQAFTYDAAGNMTSATDMRGGRSDFCYDVDYAGSPSGGAANLTRIIGPAAAAGQPRPVNLVKFDAKNNVIQSVSPRGVPSTSTSSCASDLSAINPLFAVDSTYDAAGVLLLATTRRFTDPDTGTKTAITKYEYGDAANPGLVTRIVPPRGNTSGTPDYTYAQVLTYFTSGPSAGLLKDATDALGRKTSFTVDAVGRVISAVDPLGNAAGGVPAEHTTGFTYDKEDRLRTTSRPSPVAGGTPLISETRYDAVGNPVFRIDANGQVMGMTYDERNSLYRVTETAAPWTDPAVTAPSPITTEYLRDAGGNATRIIRAKGDVSNERVTDFAFDGRGLRRSETQYPSWPSTSGALITAYSYDANGNQLTLLDPLGQTTTYGHDARNRLTSIDYSSVSTADVGLSYDLDDHRTGMTDATGASSFAYDEGGQLVSATWPGPKVVGYRYDLDGHRTKLIYPDATAVAYVFDKAGQLGSLTDWASRAVTYTYWPDGLVQGAALPDGSAASYAYDNARRLVDVSHQRLGTTISRQSYTIDGEGNVTAVADNVSGLTSAPTWSPGAAINDIVSADQTRPSLATGPDGAVYAVWADTRSGDSDIYYSRRDPATGTWSVSVRVNTVTTGAQTQPVITVDGSGNAYVAWADARLGASDDDIYFAKRMAASGSWSANIRVNSDGAGKRQYDPTIAISPTGIVMAAWYDERGGGSKRYVYSARLPAGSLTWSTNYQVSSNSTAVKGDPEVIIGSEGITYAVWRDLQSGNADIWFATLSSGGTSWSANTKISDDPGSALQDAPDIGIDTAGNVLVVWNDARTSPTQVRIRKRPAGTTVWSASTVLGGSTANAPSIAVRPDGRGYASWSNGTLGTLTTLWGTEYNPLAGTWSSPEQLTLTTEESAAASVAFTSGQLVVAYQRRPTGGNYDVYARRKSLVGDEFAYGYDRLERLTSVVGPDGPRSYSFDPVGNRLNRVAGPTTSYTYDRADRLTSAGGVSVTTDANGNLTARGADAYTYDQANQLSSATVGGTTETYVYDGQGNRFSRQIGAGTIKRYVSDVGRELPTVIDDGTRKFVYGLGLEFAVSGSSVEVFHADRLGSIRSVTDGSGAVVATYRADEWGLATASGGSSAQPFGFTGEPRDATGLTYLRARYYNPELGRFMTRDTWTGSPSQPRSLNRYAYANDNPLTHADPSGHFVDVAIDVGSIVVDVWGLAFGPPKERGGNTLALGADVAMLFLPFATGGGAIVRSASSAAASAVPKLVQGASKWGLEHIVARHWWSSGVAGVSKWGSDIGLKELKSLIDAAAGPITRREGASIILERNAGRTIGTDALGNATDWIRIVMQESGEVISAYPIPKP